MRRLALPLIALLAVLAVLGVQVAAGGGQYVPRRVANACAAEPVPAFAPRLEPLTEQIVLLGLDRAACRLGVSREALVLGLAGSGSPTPRTAAALKAGLIDAVNILDREHRLPKVSQLLPDVLSQVSLPGLVKTIIEALPAGLVDGALQTAPLLRQTIGELNVERLVHELSDASRLQSDLQSAVLKAALSQITQRLHP